MAVFSSKQYFTEGFAAAAADWNAGQSPKINFLFLEDRLGEETAELAKGCRAVCNFVNDDASEAVIQKLKGLGVELILNRCAGFDKVDLAAAGAEGVKVARVPAYSPEAVAQHAVSLLLAQKWGMTGASSEAPSPLGLDLSATTVGVLGTGRIGYLFAMVMQGFGCKIVAYDPFKNPAIEAAGIPYLTVDEVLAQADVLSLHVPLLPTTKHMIDADAIAKLKPGCTVLNVSRGGLVDTGAVVDGLQSGQISFYGSDVYEFEGPYFFDDHSGAPMADELLARLIAQPNVQLTGHQAFLTKEAVGQIVGTTIKNLSQFLEGAELTNEVKPPPTA